MQMQKDSSQETIISLMGMLAGSVVVSHISSQSATWSAMIFLLAIHLGTNYLAVRAVSMRTLNRQRANLAISNWLGEGPRSNGDELRRELQALSPEQVSAQERVFERDGVLRWKGKEVLGYCRLGVDLKTILGTIQKQQSSSGSFVALPINLPDLFHHGQNGYVIWYDHKSSTFLVSILADHGTKTVLRAWFHALYAARALKVPCFDKNDVIRNCCQEMVVNPSAGVTKTFLDQTYQVTDVLFNEFLKCLPVEWDLETGALETRSGTRACIVSKEAS
jgi:hypothetical protein